MSIIVCMEPRELIKKLRLRRGWSQAELADKAGVSTGTVGALEAKNELPKTLDTLKRIADALDVTVDYILTETGAIPPQEENAEVSRMADDIKKLSDPHKKAVEALIKTLLEGQK